MTLEKLLVRIDTPSDHLPLGRGFYQIEEDTLFVPIGEQPYTKSAFFSYLESDTVRLDIDKTGRLLFVEISRSRRLWEIVDDLIPQGNAPYADVRWLDFREKLREPRILTSPERRFACVQFSDGPACATYSLASSVVLDVDDAHTVTRLWITEIIDDVAGKQIAAFRHTDHQS